MIVSNALCGGLTVAFLLGSAYAQAKAKPSAKIEFAVQPAGPAVIGHPLTLEVVIRNAGPDSATFTFDLHPWLESYVLTAPTLSGDDGSVNGGGSSEIVSTIHAVKLGDRYCPKPENIFLLRPGGELRRFFQISLAGVAAGRSAFSGHFRLLKAAVNGSCAPAEEYGGEAKTILAIRK